VIAFAALAVVIRPRITRADVDEIQVWIVRAGCPDSRTTARPRVARPRVVAGLAGARNGVTAPRAFPCLGVVGVNESTNAVLSTSDADDDLVVHDQRREG